MVSLARRVALLVVASAVPLVAVDIAEGRRIERWKAELRSRYPDRPRCSEASEVPELVYTYVSGRCGFNSRGHSDRERSFVKPAGTLRVLLIGDSVAAGDGVERDQRFAAVLERLLGSRLGATEVVVLARTGYSTSQELYVLEDEAASYHPDLVLWSYVLNDPANPVFHNANGELGRFFVDPGRPLAFFLRRKWFRIVEKWRERGCSTEYHAHLHCAYSDQVDDSVRRMAAFSRDREIPVWVVIHPVFEDRSSFVDYSLVPLHRELRARFAAEGMPVLDLVDAYRDRAPAALALRQADGRIDPWHPNVEGHAIAASAIADWIDRGLLEDLTRRQLGGGSPDRE